MSFKKIVLGLLFFAVGSFAATVQVTDLVGLKLATDGYNLPNVVKANSDWIPLFRVDITTVAGAATDAYKLSSITFTITNVNNFDTADGDLGSALLTSLRVFTSTACISYAGGTPTYKIAGVGASAWAGGGDETVEIVFGTPITLSSYTVNSVYVAVKTGAGLEGNGLQGGADDQFSANWAADATKFNVKITSGSATYNETTAFNGDTITADVFAPAIQVAYSPIAANGQTNTVYAGDAGGIAAVDNVFKSGDSMIFTITVKDANGNGEDNNTLIGDAAVFSLLDCLDFSINGILQGPLSDATTAFAASTNGYPEFKITYTPTNTTKNMNTDGTTPLIVSIGVHDGAGNYSTTDTSFKVYLDSKTPVAVALTAPANSAYVNTLSPDFSWTASDEAHLNDYMMFFATSSNFGGDLNIAIIGKSTTSLNIKANTATFFNDDFSLGALANGTVYYWTIIATDLADHPGSWAAANYPAARSFIYDAQVPETAVFTSPTAGSTLRHGLPAISATVGDSGLSGVDSSKINMKIKQGASAYTPVTHTSVYSAVTGSYTVTYTPSTPLADGAYTVKIEAADVLGNVMTPAATCAFNVDKTSPTITDTDNDGESNEFERDAGTDWLDASEPAVSSNKLWPVNGAVINNATLTNGAVTGASQEIRISIDDPYENYAGVFNSGVDRNASTVTISGVAGTWIFGANDFPYAKSNPTGVIAMGNYGTYDRFDCQIPVPLATNGDDDGTYSVTVAAVDGAGNKATLARSFIYDTTIPSVSTVTAPAAADTGSSFILAIDATDTNGISGDGDAVKVYYIDANGAPASSGNLTADIAVAGRYNLQDSFGADVPAGNYYYYFLVKDKAGNIAYCPAGANFDKSKAIPLTITDTSGPRVVIGNDIGKAGNSFDPAQANSYIKTCVGMNLAGAPVTDFNYASSPRVDEIPTIYSWTNNKLQATIQDEAIGALFQYKASTSATWLPLTTAETVTNTVWEANWDTTGLSKTTYDVRVKAWDVLHNTTTPTSVLSAGWVQVKLAAALAPVAVIDPANTVVVAGRRIRKQAVLCADLSTTVNDDFASVKFQYKAAGGVWTDIATDSDPTANTPTNVTFTFDYADLTEYIQEQNTSDGDVVIDTTQIKAVTFNCSNNTYDRSMKFHGSSWTVTVPLVPATYDYQFDISFADGSSESFEDMDQQDDGGVDSRIVIAPFTAVWNVTGLSGSYEVRAVAKDSRGISDSAPAAFALVVDNSAPTSVSITVPADGDRLETGVAKALYAQVTDTADMDNGYVYFMYSLDGGYIWTRIANEDPTEDEWTQPWTPSVNYANDINNCLLKAVAVDEAGNIAESASINVILDATNPEILDYTVNASSASQIDLSMGTVYNWSVTTLDSDIEKLTFTTGGAIASDKYSWSPSNELYSHTGSGTLADPYKFSGTMMVNISVSEDNQQEQLTATLMDKSGRTDAVAKKINFKDVTPNPASVRDVDGLQVRSGDIVTTSNKFIRVGCSLPIDDDGVLYYQYRIAVTGTWDTWSTNTAPDDSVGAVFPPNGITLIDGNYELRILCIDDDGNADPSPATVTIAVDSSKPAIKPASIISCTTGGWLTAVEYDELVSQVQFEYRLQGASNWEYLGVDGAADSTFGFAGNTWTRTLSTLLDAGTYEVRAISQYPAGPGEADSDITPVATVVIKRDAANNRLVALNPENRISLAVSGAAFSQSYAGVEQTMTGSLIIASSQTLTEVNARLLMAGGGTHIDRYLNVSSSSGVWTASMDLSELFGGGNGMIVINATDISGNILSASQSFAVVAAGTNPGGITVGRVTLAAGPFGAALENTSALAVMPASMPTLPAAQTSLITPVGEPWEFLLSEPEAFKVRNTCTINMSYTDAEVSGMDETKLGVAYWDESKGIWSADGIMGVTRNTVGNTVTFTTNHFSKYCLAVINTAPAVTFVSPASGGMAGKSPIIEADILDGFSAIREVKVILDGVDRTASFDDEAYRDGIDNDGNGLVDENIVNANADVETALNTSGATSAKYKVRPGLQLFDGAHTLAITATNEQGISTTQAISFTVGGAVGITSAYIAPNPYNPTSGYDAQIKVNMTSDANITLKVYDFGGKLVYTSKTNSLSNGNDVFWNGRTNGNKLLANGVYLIRIEADTSQGTDSKVIKAALLR